MPVVCTSIDTDLLGLGMRLGVYLQLVALCILIFTGAHGTIASHGEAASVSLASILAVLFIRLHNEDIHAAEFLCMISLAQFQTLIACWGMYSGVSMMDDLGLSRLQVGPPNAQHYSKVLAVLT